MRRPGMILVKPLPPADTMKFFPLAFYLRQAIRYRVKRKGIETQTDVTGIDFDILGSL